MEYLPFGSIFFLSFLILAGVLWWDLFMSKRSFTHEQEHPDFFSSPSLKYLFFSVR